MNTYVKEVKAKVFVVSEKLDNYYDGNDKSLECIFFERENAEGFVSERDWMNLVIEERCVY